VRNWSLFWSLLFALAALFSVGIFAYAPFSPDWWLPNDPARPYQVVSTFGRDIDNLFVIILCITGIVFMGTLVALVWAIARFGDRPGRVAQYFHARQFQWVMRYPGPDHKLHTADDLHLVNDLHFVKGKPALIYLKSSDILHSFFLPQMRIKQDAVPGLTIPVWFDSDTAGRYELACAELCGWGHYKMKGNVTVHASQAEYDDWMRNALREQSRDQVAVASAPQGR
jgi:cytochrome c oxidase subunit 2